MSNTEIFIDPTALDEEISSFRDATEVVDSSPYETDKGSLALDAVDKYISALEEMNTAMTDFKALSENDIQNLEFIRADWMNVDRELAGLSTGERITGS